MALIQCKECKSQVSTTAKSCPACGAAVPKKSNKKALFVTGLFVFVVYSIASTFESAGEKPQATAAVSIPVAKPPLDCIKDEAEILEFVKSRINDFPNSALEVLRPCAEQTNNSAYKTKITEAEAAVKRNEQKETQLKIANAKLAVIDAKAEAKRKKSQGVNIGMTMDEVRASSWGKPRKINRTIHATSEREQWVYDGGYLYFSNGILNSIQN